jgi:hypothetical protein
MAERAIEPAQVEALPACGQGFGQIGSEMELMMPAPAALGEVAAVSRNDDVEDREP